MNANELADELEAAYSDNDATDYMIKAATMLRQLQAKNEAGKIMIKGYSKVIDEQQAEIEMLKTKLSEWHIWNEYE